MKGKNQDKGVYRAASLVLGMGGQVYGKGYRLGRI